MIRYPICTNLLGNLLVGAIGRLLKTNPSIYLVVLISINSKSFRNSFQRYQPSTFIRKWWRKPRLCADFVSIQKKQERLYTPPNRVWEEKGMVQVKDIFKDPKLLGSSSYQMFGTIRSSQKHVLNDF